MFQSTRPRRGAISTVNVVRAGISCFNPRAPGGARFQTLISKIEEETVSIHAPPEGRDGLLNQQSWPEYRFNPRAPGGARLAKTAALLII